MPQSNLIAIVEVDLNCNCMGLKERCLDLLEGKPILQHTLEILHRYGKFEQIIVACCEDDLITLQKALPEDICIFCPHDVQDVLNRKWLRQSRKWSLTGWRGGLNSTFLYDELGNPHLMRQILAQFKAEGCVLVPPGAALLSCDILAQQHKIFNETALKYDYSMALSNAPIGMNVQWIGVELLNVLAQKDATLRGILRYKLEAEESDPSGSPYFLNTELAISSAAIRLQADSFRSHQLVCDTFSALTPEERENPFDVINKAQNVSRDHFFPQDIEIEICGQSTIRDSLYPEGKSSRSESFLSLTDFQYIIDTLCDSPYDDLRLSLGGYGDPLLHPDLFQMIDYAHEQGIFALHFSTNGSLLNESHIEQLMQSPLDAFSIRLDAINSSTNNLLKEGRDFDHLQQWLTQFAAERKSQKNLSPIFIPEFTKVAENFDEMEEFFDHWMKSVGFCIIRGFNPLADQLKDRNLLHLNLAKRIPCISVMSKLVIFSDTQIVPCMEDFLGKYPLGKVRDLPRILESTERMAYQETQQNKAFTTSPLCKSCRRWDQP